MNYLFGPLSYFLTFLLLFVYEPQVLTMNHLEAGFIIWLSAFSLGIVIFAFEWLIRFRDFLVFKYVFIAFCKQKEPQEEQVKRLLVSLQEEEEKIMLQSLEESVAEFQLEKIKKIFGNPKNRRKWSKTRSKIEWIIIIVIIRRRRRRRRRRRKAVLSHSRKDVSHQCGHLSR